MTYCVGLDLKDGLVLLSDTRTNAGVDHISTFSKMHVVEVPGERVITLLSAGNLAVTQAVVNLLNEGIERAAGLETLANVPSMFRAARLVGDAIRRVYVKDGEAMQAQNVSFDVSMLLGGQIKGRNMRLFELYSAGNFIEATPDTPFLQIGEHKYGKPILDRVVRVRHGLGGRGEGRAHLHGFDLAQQSRRRPAGRPSRLPARQPPGRAPPPPDRGRQLFPPGPRPLVRRPPRSLPDPPPPGLDGRVS